MNRRCTTCLLDFAFAIVVLYVKLLESVMLTHRSVVGRLSMYISADMRKGQGCGHMSTPTLSLDSSSSRLLLSVSSL